MQLDLNRLRRARRLFSEGDTNDVLVTTLEGLSVTLGLKAYTPTPISKLKKPLRDSIVRFQKLSDSINYVSLRLFQVFLRLRHMNWMRGQLAYKPSKDPFVLASDPNHSDWSLLTALAIKDFHVDVASLMDALTPVIIQGADTVKPRDRPGWADIRSGTRRSYRQRLPEELRIIVDQVDATWWDDVKKVRDHLTHRNHQTIVFGTYDDGTLFQIYDETWSPGIVMPEILYPQGQNVVDFDLYSAFIVAELICVIDELGKDIAPRVGISLEALAQMSLRVVDKSVSRSIDNLIDIVAKA